MRPTLGRCRPCRTLRRASRSPPPPWPDQFLLADLILAAQVRGLATCPQVSFVRFQSIIAAQLGLDPEEMVTCGMSLGYADVQAPVNRLNMPREPLETFTRW